MATKINSIQVRELPIRLGQFLKYANLVQDGIEAKLRIQNGEILVNGSIETRRGRQLKVHDTVTFEDSTWTIED